MTTATFWAMAVFVGVNWYILLCVHYFMMQLSFFALQVVRFLSYMVVEASFARVVR